MDNEKFRDLLNRIIEARNNGEEAPAELKELATSLTPEENQLAGIIAKAVDAGVPSGIGSTTWALLTLWLVKDK